MGLYDQWAAGVGIISALLVLCCSKGWKVDEKLFYSFSNGSSSTYLVLISYGIFWDSSLKNQIMSSNSVLLFGAMAYTSILNIRVLFVSIRESHEAKLPD